VTVKVRSADFTTHTRSETAALGTTDLTALTAVARRLVRSAVPEGGVRLIGVSLAGLGDEPPPGLFDEHPAGAGAAGTLDDPIASAATDPGAERAPPADAAPTGEDGGPAGDRPGPDAGAARSWRAGDDVAHPEHGHGWVQGAGHGRVTVRFETRSTGPGRARTLAADDPDLRRADPADSLT
jgi:DNA polymerase-4